LISSACQDNTCATELDHFSTRATVAQQNLISSACQDNTCATELDHFSTRATVAQQNLISSARQDNTRATELDQFSTRATVAQQGLIKSACQGSHSILAQAQRKGGIHTDLESSIAQSVSATEAGSIARTIFRKESSA
jgi:hypothetical protein